MYALIIAVFIFGYIFIALEHPFKINKAASAILTGVICWTILALYPETFSLTKAGHSIIDESIIHHLGEISQILFFLLGAMTIVEIIDSHGGFEIITSKIITTNRVRLLWIIGCVTFLLSSVLDNLTTAIVLATLIKNLFKEQEDIWFYGGIVVIAANAGGAWSPIGDVTTIMLWIGGQVSAFGIIKELILPSIACLLIPLLVLTFSKKNGNIERPNKSEAQEISYFHQNNSESKWVLWIGIGGLLFVPVFKTFTHLPPFLGILFSLGVLWVFTEILHKRKSDEERHHLSVASIIRRVDTPSVLFFLGILLAVASLETAGLLDVLATSLNSSIGNIYIINILIGLISAIVDNVPLVAGAMGMYPLSTYPQNHTFWELLAYCAGTGGSVLIIGSAAGVAIMGILKINFIWYAKKISWLALLGYLGGIIVYYLLN
jgi:Na+/H+ antiporter NhaD/arsenite permease-like protein